MLFKGCLLCHFIRVLWEISCVMSIYMPLYYNRLFIIAHIMCLKEVAIVSRAEEI